MHRRVDALTLRPITGRPFRPRALPLTLNSRVIIKTMSSFFVRAVGGGFRVVSGRLAGRSAGRPAGRPGGARVVSGAEKKII